MNCCIWWVIVRYSTSISVMAIVLSVEQIDIQRLFAAWNCLHLFIFVITSCSYGYSLVDCKSIDHLYTCIIFQLYSALATIIVSYCIAFIINIVIERPIWNLLSIVDKHFYPIADRHRYTEAKVDSGVTTTKWMLIIIVVRLDIRLNYSNVD
jgi:hypothetical protein